MAKSGGRLTTPAAGGAGNLSIASGIAAIYDSASRADSRVVDLYTSTKNGNTRDTLRNVHQILSDLQNEAEAGRMNSQQGNLVAAMDSVRFMNDMYQAASDIIQRARKERDQDQSALRAAGGRVASLGVRIRELKNQL